MIPKEPLDTLHIEHDTPMTATYVSVVLLEAAIVIALFILGRLFS